MKTEPHTMLTIVTEAALEMRLTEDLAYLGARGWTITDARGKGAQGKREVNWDAGGNIRVEVICDEHIADRIAKHVRDKYFKDHAIVIYLSEVGVLRGEKF